MWKRQVLGKTCNCLQISSTFGTPWTVACQAPLSMGFSRQEYQSGLQFPCPGDLPNPGIKPRSPALQTDSLLTELQGSESESHSVMSNSLWPHGLYNPWNSPGQNTGVGSLSLLQGIFPIQGSNPGLLHCRQILYWTMREAPQIS